MKEKKRTASSAAAKVDRKTVEKNRRSHMKRLCLQLTSLIPSHHFNTSSKETLSQQDQLDLAASYIIHLKKRIEKSENYKRRLGIHNGTSRERSRIGLKLPVFELRDLGPAIEVTLISSLNKNFMLYEVISVLEEEGAEVVSASFSTVGDKIFHTIHAQVRISRVGVETTRVYQRLQELVYYTSVPCDE